MYARPFPLFSFSKALMVAEPVQVRISKVTFIKVCGHVHIE